MIAPTQPPAGDARDLASLRVLIFGLGSFGGGAGAARFFCERGAEVWVTDLRTEEHLARSLDELRALPIRRWTLGRHLEEDFAAADWVVVNPAVPPGNPFLDFARRHGRTLVTEIGLFLRWCPSPHVIGITGSNGKSTTSQLVYEMLAASGVRAHLGGNIGASLLPSLAQIGAEDRVVLELSSFQLERMEPDTPQPRASAITQFSPNHLDWHADLSSYRAAKERILGASAPGLESLALLPAASEHFERWRALAKRKVAGFSADAAPAGGIGFEGGSIQSRIAGYEGSIPIAQADAQSALTPLRGAANRANSACAAGLALFMGANFAGIAGALNGFRALKHRQERIGGARGVAFVNDSKATTPDAALCALEAFAPRVVVLLGGSSKGSDFGEFARGAAKYARACVAYGKTGPEIAAALRAAGVAGERIIERRQMADAFAAAAELATAGDTVLLSPACASFDEFRNYEERGERFRALAHAWCKLNRTA